MLRILKKKFKKYDLIILDELGYISFDNVGTELLFNFISDRCEHASPIFTTNLRSIVRMKSFTMLSLRKLSWIELLINPM